MFANVGWGEILIILVVALVVVGPEKLPKLVQDFRAMVLAVRHSIEDARSELKNDFGDDFDEFRKPLEDLQQLRSMNPKAMLTRTLLEGDDTMLNFLDKKPAEFFQNNGSDGSTPAGAASPVAASSTQPAGTQASSVPQSNPQSAAGNTQATSHQSAAADMPRTINWSDDDAL